MNNIAEKFFLVAFADVRGVGDKTLGKLVEYFGTARQAWTAGIDDLILAGLKRNVADAIVTFRREHGDAPDRIVDFCDRHKIALCSLFDDDYPPLLKKIDSPPMFFYYRGSLAPLAKRIAVVGARNNTDYGKNIALALGEELAAAGFSVVSGAARGIDTFAHRGALKTGRTVAVLGCGINRVYPPENKCLLEEIAKRGIVISELHPLAPPNSTTFPVRNRIIAGLADAMVVVEAAEKSGSIIAANFASKYGRKLFAVPGDIRSDVSEGCHKLIRNGAILASSVRDILNEVNHG